MSTAVKNKGIGRVKPSERAKPKGKRRSKPTMGVISASEIARLAKAELAYVANSVKAEIDRAADLFAACRIVAELYDHAKETMPGMTYDDLGRIIGRGMPEIRYGKRVLHKAGSPYSKAWVSMRLKGYRDYPCRKDGSRGFDDPDAATEYRQTVNGNNGNGKGKGKDGETSEKWKSNVASSLKTALNKLGSYAKLEAFVKDVLSVLAAESAKADAKKAAKVAA